MTKPQMQKIIPAGKRPTAEVHHFTLKPMDVMMDNLRYARDGVSFMVAQPGEYVRLVADGELQMSDTDMEWRTNMRFLKAAKGDVFVAGLGIGLVLVPLLKKPEVKSVTVIERNPDVIALVAPHFKSEKLRVIEGDAKLPDKTLNGDKFDTVWLDIWSDFSSDNIVEMEALKQVYRKRVRRPGFVGCWSEIETRSMARRGIV